MSLQINARRKIFFAMRIEPEVLREKGKDLPIAVRYVLLCWHVAHAVEAKA